MFFNNKVDIENWLKSVHIRNFYIHDDLTVDVHQDVSIYNLRLSSLPVQFGRINGYFECSHNNLYSLKGAPREVNGDACFNYNCLTSIEYCPSIVHKDLMLRDNPILNIDLIELPSYVNGNIYLGNKDFDLCSNIKYFEELYDKKGELITTLEQMKSHILKYSLDNQLSTKSIHTKTKI